MKNQCAKMRKADDPYEIWENEIIQWTWYVLKKWQADDNKVGARWFCLVKTPIVPQGEMGDCYSKEIIDNAMRIK